MKLVSQDFLRGERTWSSVGCVTKTTHRIKDIDSKDLQFVKMDKLNK